MRFTRTGSTYDKPDRHNRAVVSQPIAQVNNDQQSEPRALARADEQSQTEPQVECSRHTGTDLSEVCAMWGGKSTL